MSLSCDLTRYFETIESTSGVAMLYQSDALNTLVSSPEFQAFKAQLEKLPPEHRLLVALRSLASQKTALSPRLLDAELVVTFPGSNAITARHTLHVVRQMITAATKEILVAGYAITSAGGVLTQLAEAARRGVRIVLVCSDWKNLNGTTASILTAKNWPIDAPRPKIHEYRKDATEKESAGMHVKCIIVDGRDMLIGSANFTFPGLNTNFEMGVRINGRVAESARAAFAESLRTARFVEFTAFSGVP